MRIVSLIPSATEIVAALGLAESLVGITHSCDYPPGLDADRVTSTSVPKDASSAEIDRFVKEGARSDRPLYELDVDLLERLSPDLVLTQAVCDVCAVGEGQALAGIEGLSIRPKVISLHPHRFDEVLADFVRVGEAAGVPDRGRKVVEGLRKRVERVKSRVDAGIDGPPGPDVDAEDRVAVQSRGASGAAAKTDRPRVVVLEWIDPPFSAGHWTPEIVRMAGGREVLSEPGERSRELAWDEVFEADPDVLVLACCGQDVSRTLDDLRILESKPGFRELRAVRDGRIFVADGGAHFSRPGPRLVDSLEFLAETLHPSGGEGRRALAQASMAPPH